MVLKEKKHKCEIGTFICLFITHSNGLKWSKIIFKEIK